MYVIIYFFIVSYDKTLKQNICVYIAKIEKYERMNTEKATWIKDKGKDLDKDLINPTVIWSPLSSLPVGGIFLICLKS